MTKIFTGKVVSTKMQKTVSVLIERKLRHPIYHKIVIRHNKFKVHNEKFKLKEGDIVKIKETRPISKDKFFTVIEQIQTKK